MKTKLPLLLIAVFTLGTLNAYAQAERGNGGIAVVCRDTTNQIISARLLDLWEPETFTPYQDFNRSVDDQLNQAVLKIENFGLDMTLVKTRLEEVKKDLIPVKRPLMLTNDALPEYAPEKGCAFEQVASYGMVKSIGAVKLRVYNEIYDSPKFSNTDRAALILHEAMYALDREMNGAKLSEKARLLNAIAFSNQTFDQQNKIKLESISKTPNEKLTMLRESVSLNLAIVSNSYLPKGNIIACHISLSQNGETLLDQNFTLAFLGVKFDNIPVHRGVLKMSFSCPDGKVFIFANDNGSFLEDLDKTLLGKSSRYTNVTGIEKTIYVDQKK